MTLRQYRAEIEQLRAERDEIRGRHDALWEMDRRIIGDLKAELNHTGGAKRKHCPTCTCKRVYKTAAERQKAYRERHKAKPSM
jgi:hypothetical protein